MNRNEKSCTASTLFRAVKRTRPGPLPRDRGRFRGRVHTCKGPWQGNRPHHTIQAGQRLPWKGRSRSGHPPARRTSMRRCLRPGRIMMLMPNVRLFRKWGFSRPMVPWHSLCASASSRRNPAHLSHGQVWHVAPSRLLFCFLHTRVSLCVFHGDPRQMPVFSPHGFAKSVRVFITVQPLSVRL